MVTDAAQAGREPELAVLSSVAHGGNPARRKVLAVLVDALAHVEEEQAVLYLELVYTALPAAAKRHLKGLVMSIHTERPRGEFAQALFAEAEAMGEARGAARGEARAVLQILHARCIEVSDPVRQRISECDDPERLDEWVRRAVTAERIEDVLD